MEVLVPLLLLFEKNTVKDLSNATFSLSHRQAGAPMINIQSTLRTAPDLCKNVSFAVLFGNNGNSHAVPTHSDIYVSVCVKNMCMYTLILHNVETLVGQ